MMLPNFSHNLHAIKVYYKLNRRFISCNLNMAPSRLEIKERLVAILVTDKIMYVLVTIPRLEL
jgi:hypothetical protein